VAGTTRWPFSPFARKAINGVGILIVVLIVAAMSVRVIKQYERVVLFELGKVKEPVRGPGLIFIIPIIDRVHRVSLRIITMPIQSQGIITKDNVSIDVAAVAYYRAKDPIRPSRA
jgi:regulator of protease activity HflC (stomatin/prohibitin superfamily)